MFSIGRWRMILAISRLSDDVNWKTTTEGDLEIIIIAGEMFYLSTHSSGTVFYVSRCVSVSRRNIGYL